MLTPTTVVLKLPLDDRAALAPWSGACPASGTWRAAVRRDAGVDLVVRL